jgi:excisionase family DNA binding protein
MPGELLTIPETAKFLRIGRDSTYRLVREGRIPVVRLGGKLIRVPRAALLAHLEQMAEEAMRR